MDIAQDADAQSQDLNDAELLFYAHPDRLNGQLLEWWLVRGDEYTVLLSETVEHSGLQDQWREDTWDMVVEAAQGILGESLDSPSEGC